MVITAVVLVTSGVAGSSLFLAFADLGFALGPAGAPEDALPIVQAVQPRSLLASISRSGPKLNVF